VVVFRIALTQHKVSPNCLLLFLFLLLLFCLSSTAGLTQGIFCEDAGSGAVTERIPYVRLFPFKAQVGKELHRALDDKKKAVRVLAGRVRNKWLVMKQFDDSHDQQRKGYAVVLRSMYVLYSVRAPTFVIQAASIVSSSKRQIGGIICQ
jgi:hypothetical protein